MSKIIFNFTFQNENDSGREINVINLTKDGERVEPKDFELLKVLGQGSFGKVKCYNQGLQSKMQSPI